jgi:hypothetical protein
MPARREKRALKLPKLEKPISMQISVIDKSVKTKRCFAFSICARERYWCGVSPNKALNSRMKWKHVRPEARATAQMERVSSIQSADLAAPGESVVRELRKSAKGAAARHHAGEELAIGSGGVLDSATVVRGFLKSPQGAAARRKPVKELARPFGGALNTAPVLGEFLKRSRARQSRRRSSG